MRPLLLVMAATLCAALLAVPASPAPACGGCNTLRPNGDLRVAWNHQCGMPAKFRLRPIPKEGQTGEIVVVVDYWRYSFANDPKQIIVHGTGETPLMVPVQGAVDWVEFHWISGNARSLSICW